MEDLPQKPSSHSFLHMVFFLNSYLCKRKTTICTSVHGHNLNMNPILLFSVLILQQDPLWNLKSVVYLDFSRNYVKSDSYYVCSELNHVFVNIPDEVI